MLDAADAIYTVNNQSIFSVATGAQPYPEASCYEKAKLIFFSEPEWGLKPREKLHLQKISPVLKLQREETLRKKMAHICPRQTAKEIPQL